MAPAGVARTQSTTTSLRAARRAPRASRASGARRGGGGGGRAVVCASAATASDVTPLARVSVLAEALPYLQRFHGRTFVIKYGGAAMKDPTLKERVVRDVALLATVGIRPVLVHGGGPEINQWLEKVGIEPKFINGLRVTDEETMDVVEMVLTGRVNKSLVSLINQAGGKAVGMCGKDGELIVARKEPTGTLGFVGEVSAVDVTYLNSVLDAGGIPVVATVAQGEDGHALNVNADIAAGEIAASLGAEKLILMTDVPGVLMDKEDPTTLVRQASIADVRKLKADGIIAGGMIPKVDCCVRSIAQGVTSSHILDGRAEHSLLLEVFTNEGNGTMIVG